MVGGMRGQVNERGAFVFAIPEMGLPRSWTVAGRPFPDSGFGLPHPCRSWFWSDRVRVRFVGAEAGANACRANFGRNPPFAKSGRKGGATAMRVAIRKDGPAPSFCHYATGMEGLVEIESQWTARRRERIGVLPVLERTHPPAQNAGRVGQPPFLKSPGPNWKGWASPARTIFQRWPARSLVSLTPGSARPRVVILVESGGSNRGGTKCGTTRTITAKTMSHSGRRRRTKSRTRTRTTHRMTTPIHMLSTESVRAYVGEARSSTPHCAHRPPVR